MASQVASPQVFFYSDIPPEQWASELTKIKKQGHGVVQIPVLWGKHETVKGACDFNRSPRLRLEHLFQLVEAAKLEAEILLGFTVHPQVFPYWALSTLPLESVIPSQLLGEHLPPESLYVPSYYHDLFKKHFIPFLKNVAEMVSLYQFPQGPIKRVSWDMGVYAYELNANHQAEYITQLVEKYSSISDFNLRFQTAFPEFSQLHSKAAFHTLFKKRPWLAAYDYRYCRSKLHHSFFLDIAKALSPYGVQLQETKTPEYKSENAEVFVEACYFDTTPEGKSFLLQDVLKSETVATGAQFVWNDLTFRKKTPATFHQNKPLELNKQQTVTLFSGKFMSSQSIKQITLYMQQGGKVIFPFGYPEYDETLSRVTWATPPQNITHTKISREQSRGKIVYFEPLTSMTQSAWDHRIAECEQVKHAMA